MSIVVLGFVCVNFMCFEFIFGNWGDKICIFVEILILFELKFF